MAIIDQVEKILIEKNIHTPPENLKNQREAFQKLKKQLNDAGLRYGDKYETPLMHRLGRCYSK